MPPVEREKQNPILKPNFEHPWEAVAAFNGSVAFDGEIYHMVYRAWSQEQDHLGQPMRLSSIGYAESRDGVNFTGHRQLFVPSEDWEKFGCEDPRVTLLDGTYYIFYTALSEYPFNANGIKVAVAVTRDFLNFEKHPVTPFNAKAMTLFPELINGQLTALLSVHTDLPPARVCLASFRRPEDLWSPAFWQQWYKDLEDHVLFVRRNDQDHVEVGAPPVKTKQGWLAVFSYIKDYFAPPPTFGVEAILLDLNNPFRIIGRTVEPILEPETDYERGGNVSDIVFPTGAVLQKTKLSIYYGAADTTTCLATLDINPLLKTMLVNGPPTIRLRRSSFNPIISPIAEHAWENKATFNPAAWYDGKMVHLLYRAQGADNTSVLGYAASRDGLSISDRLNEPAYVPRADFEQKLVPGGNSGCEDPRLTQIGDTLYMCYTAYDGKNPPRVALTSISVDDFWQQHWENWAAPKLISPPGQDDKDAALFPKKIKGQYAILHRLGQGICLDFSMDLNFGANKWLDGGHLFGPRDNSWDSVRIGIAAPPIETEVGWLLLYHGISHHTKYRLGAALLDLKNPTKVLVRTDEPILEPELPYEKQGQVPQVVFPCGAVVMDGTLFVYYGAADTVVGAAHIKLEEILG
jgi:predicted GH43/DUF377 family glycosyl hydrolase